MVLAGDLASGPRQTLERLFGALVDGGVVGLELQALEVGRAKRGKDRTGDEAQKEETRERRKKKDGWLGGGL